MLDNIWAKSKPQESLATHTNAIVDTWRNLQSLLPDRVKEEEFDKRSFLAVLFHDFGKVAENFQDVIQGKRKNYDQFIRHEFLSGMLLWMTDPQYYKENPYSLFAVFTHHKPFEDHLFQNDVFKQLKIDIDNFQELEDYWHIKTKAYNIDSSFPTSSIKKLNRPNALAALYSEFAGLLDSVSESTTNKDRNLYIRYKAILQICDWTASGHQKLSKGIFYTPKLIEEKVFTSLIESGKMKPSESFSFKKFQQESLKEGNIIAIAPTGSGKTEAALIWASQKQTNDRILYLLPTRVTSNAIYERLVNIFCKENCAVVHSSAFLYRKEQEDEKGNKDYDKFKDYLKERTFFRNVNVCTVDQLLTQGFNLGYWEIKTFHCLNARIIIDEIHLYQPYTLGLIIATISYLKKEWKTQFYIMTATMPQKLLELLKETLEIEEDHIIRDQQLLNESRNTFEVRYKTVDEIESEVWEAIDENKKILLVVNTVDEAIRLFQVYKFAPCEVICYHSRFIQKDRAKKEKEIFTAEKADKPVLLIATQVVEVSLDIDFDMLFTENAPIDALVQRSGRVNRKRKKEETKVVVFQHTEKSEEWIYNLPGVLVDTWELLEEHNEQRLTEAQLTQLVDKVYAKVDVKANEDYQKGLIAYKRMRKEHLAYIKDNLNQKEAYTREGLDSINVIPDIFYEKLAYTDDIFEKSKHEVSVRRYRAQSGTVPDSTNKGFVYLKCNYDFEIGLTFLKGNEPPAGSLKSF